MGFFIQQADDALTAVYNSEVAKGQRPKSFQPSSAATQKIKAPSITIKL